MFDLFYKQLKNQVLQEKKKENYLQFNKDVTKTMKKFSVDTLRKTVESMEHRLMMSVKRKRNLTKQEDITWITINIKINIICTNYKKDYIIR